MSIVDISDIVREVESTLGDAVDEVLSRVKETVEEQADDALEESDYELDDEGEETPERKAFAAGYAAAVAKLSEECDSASYRG